MCLLWKIQNGAKATTLSSARRRTAKRAGFTLIELLVVLAISAILIALLARGLTAALGVMSAGEEEAHIKSQLTDAMDTIEVDVRLAKDVDVEHWQRMGNKLSDTTWSPALRLLCADPVNVRKDGLVIYEVDVPSAELVSDSPSERPNMSMTLYRTQSDSNHSGARRESVCDYLVGAIDEEVAMRVRYKNKRGQACALDEDIYSLEVTLSGRSEAGTLVQVARTIPLAKG